MGRNEQNQLIENYDHKIRDIAADGHVVFTHWVEDGTEKNTGKPYHVEGMSMYEFRNGKIYSSIQISFSRIRLRYFWASQKNHL